MITNYMVACVAVPNIYRGFHNWSPSARTWANLYFNH